MIVCVYSQIAFRVCAAVLDDLGIASSIKNEVSHF